MEIKGATYLYTLAALMITFAGIFGFVNALDIIMQQPSDTRA